MSFKPIDIMNENLNPFKMIGKDWFLVTAGDKNGYNTMTASWGMMGVIWNKNVAVTVIRPQRHTKSFVDNSEYFTISFYGEEYRDALKFCGTKSGRDYDKAKETGLTPLFLDKTVAFEEASLILVCKKIYVQDLTPESFIYKEIAEQNYPTKDFHTAYIGEVVKAYKK